MIEKVNPSHPDKIADRIAGSIVDMTYSKSKSPICAVEVLIGHGRCHIINETNCHLNRLEVKKQVKRIVGSNIKVDYKEVKQDALLSENQAYKTVRCGDNGIFKGVPLNEEEKKLTKIAKNIYSIYASDGKYLIDNEKVVICQSNANENALKKMFPKSKVNPLGHWTGGTNVDAGATNRKLGSDMGRAATGGGLHGKDLSKADVSVNIYAHLIAQELGKEVNCICSIGDTEVKVVVGDGKPFNKPFKDIVSIAFEYILGVGGFERFAQWGLIR